ncbi:cell wall anchor protein [Micromonospora sp. NPDC047557]|uniref:cell wall anchor protein n=1 Tax=Micromonospora sp. NPDC047557 TaxID=3364250 RepID=UPI00371BF671
MPHPSPARRWLAAMAVVGLLATASAAQPVAAVGAPAAGQPVAALGLYANSAIVAPGGPRKWVALHSLAPQSLGTYTVRVDRSGVTAFADVAEGEGRRTCTTEGPVITCVIDGANEPDQDLLTLGVTARPDAQVGQRGELALTVTAPGVGTATYRSTVSIGEGVDLATAPDVDLNGTLGSTVTLPLSVTNRGATTAHGLVLYLYGFNGLTPAKRYENCEYVDLDQDNSPFACTFDDSLAPGETVAVDSTFAGTVGADTWAPNLYYNFGYWFTPADWEEFQSQYRPAEPLGPKGTDPALTLVPATDTQVRGLGQTDTRFVNNDTTITLTVAGDQRADVAAVGATVSGAVGATVATTVGYVNNGPARAGDSGQQGLAVTTRVTLPAGVTAVTVPNSCVDPTDEEWRPGKPGARLYECSGPGGIAQGERMGFEFGLRIDRAGSQTGAVALRTRSGSGPIADLNPANDTATILINPKGGNPNGNGGNPNGGGGGDGGSLPITGTPVGLIAVVGALLVGIGAGGFLLTRRRTRVEA